ncbi:hypothetical protein AAEW94_002679 [Escherichia coli]|uniref:hypothetical protein n=1 Tax=Escherichia coli TaxID=562 RepID=UPI0006695127|nr:hypothetical protein [Escherichia coli]EIH0341810.1 hypothetical protein [Shigella boydii]ODG75684.1 hypothetical protein BFF49_26710 [Shigella sp. FC2045]ODG84181.1 hypothetical protein BFF50_26690 [Shigella sp. FC2928]EEX2622724.1 hypothetical protein [Escherichia coli]EFK2754308.1 hypothetical protein [Escherichia coli]
MKHVSTRAANADNNRIVTGRDIYEIAFTPPIHANAVLGLTGTVILTGNAGEVKAFLSAAATGHSGCMVTPSPVLAHDTWLRIRLLMGEMMDAK